MTKKYSWSYVFEGKMDSLRDYISYQLKFNNPNAPSVTRSHF